MSNAEPPSTVTAPPDAPTATPTRDRAALALSLLIAVWVGGALLFWWRDERDLSARQQAAFNKGVAHVVKELQDRLALYEEAVRGVQGLFRSSTTVSADEFRDFIAALEMGRRLPAIDGITLTRYVRADDLDAFEREQGLSVFPPGERKDYYPITYIEPSHNAAARGFDIGSEVHRREAAERARDGADAAMTGPLKLITPGGTHLDALIVLPLYAPGAAIGDIPARRAALRGWVTAGYHLERLFSPTDDELRATLAYQVYDGVPHRSGSLLWSSHSRPPRDGGRYTAEVSLDIYGRLWTLRFRSTPELEARGPVSDLYLVPASALGFGLALGYALWLLLGSRHRALVLARQMTAALGDSEERYRQMFERSKAAALLIDPSDGAIVDANEAAAAFYGWSSTRLRRMHISDINTLSPEQTAAEMRRARDERRSHFLFRHRLADGEVRDVEAHSGPVRVDGRTLLYSIIHDVTERTRAEQALRRSERKYRSIIDSTAEGFWLIDAPSRGTLEVNRALCRMLGYAEEEMLGRTPLEFADEASRPVFEEAFRRIATQEHRHYEVTLLRKDGSGLPAEFNATTLRDDDGRPAMAVAFVSDISERKRAEEKRRLAAT